MNNGTLTVVLVLVAVFIILTVVNVGYKAVNKKYVTETALESVGTDSEIVQGVFVRDEQVITYGGKGVISYGIPDGGKLGIGSVIANVYSDEAQIELVRHYRALENELSLLERISNPGTVKTAQPSNISELFTQNYKDYLYSREKGDLSDLQAQREEMLVLLSTYQLVTVKDASYAQKMQQIKGELESLIAKLHALGAKNVVLTGVSFSPDELGSAVSDGSTVQYDFNPKLEKMSHGTGDVYASVFAGAVLRGKTALEAAALAADVVCEAIKATDDDHWYGVSFERAIPFLVERLA